MSDFKRLKKRTGGYCYYCGKKLNSRSMTKDHVFPQSIFGKNRPFNIRLACKKCNLLKADMVPLYLKSCSETLIKRWAI